MLCDITRSVHQVGPPLLGDDHIFSSPGPPVVARALQLQFIRSLAQVRFFERVKIERRLHRLQARAAGAELSPAEQQQLRQLQEDLQYVMHFPKGEKYVSLLKEAEGEEARQQLAAERARLRALVRQQLAEAAMVAEADEGRSLAEHKAAAGVGQVAAVEVQVAGNGQSDEDDFFLASDGEEAAEQQQPAAAPGRTELRNGAASVRQPQPHHNSKRRAENSPNSSDDDDDEEEEGISSGEDEEGAEEQQSNREDGGGGSSESDLDMELPQASPRREDRAAARSKLQPVQKPQGQQHAHVPQGDQQQQRQQQYRQRPGQQRGSSAGLQAGKRPTTAGRIPSAQEVSRGPAKPGHNVQPHKHGQGAGARRPQVNPPPQASPAEKQPLRTRAEGGRKRRKK